MKSHSRVFIFSLLTSLVYSPQLLAKPSFQGPNYSGMYFCKGSNVTVGDYEVFVTLKLNKINSHGKFGVYDLITETENNVSYLGQAITTGNKLAVTFKLSNAHQADYSTGLGEFKKANKSNWVFVNNYYEPDDNGGNYGHEVCTMQNTPKPSAAKSAKFTTK